MNEDIDEIKTSFIDAIYGRVDDRLIEQYLPGYLAANDQNNMWAHFAKVDNVDDMVSDFKWFVRMEEHSVQQEAYEL
jgi:hypothetical protein